MISMLLVLTLSQCATGITDNSQTLCGQKAFTGLVDLQDSLVLRGAAYTLAPQGGIFIASDNDLGFVFQGNRNAGSVDPELLVISTTQRTAGPSIAVANQNGVHVGRINFDGEFESLAPASSAAFTDNSSVSGHTALTSARGYFPVIVGRLAEQRIRYISGGGCLDGGSVPSDGGHCYLPFAALHGNVEASSSAGCASGSITDGGDCTGGMYAGFIFSANNPAKPVGTPQGPPGAAAFYIDWLGGMGNYGPLNLADFGTSSWTVETAPSGDKWTYGRLESTLAYAHDQHRWYFQGPPDSNYEYPNIPDAGNWQRLLTQEDLLPILLRLADAGL